MGNHRTKNQNRSVEMQNGQKIKHTNDNYTVVVFVVVTMADLEF